MMCCAHKGGPESLDTPSTGRLGHKARNSKPTRLSRSAYSNNGVTLLRRLLDSLALWLGKLHGPHHKDPIELYGNWVQAHTRQVGVLEKNSNLAP